MSQQDIAFYLGETWTIDGTANDANGVPLDLTGAQVKFRISSKEEPLLTQDTSNGVQIMDANLGRYRINVGPGEQANISAGRYQYEIMVITTDGAASVQNSGTFFLTKSLFSP